MSTPKAFAGNPSFNAHHSPLGAYMTFTCGNFGTRGGIGLQSGQPADQDIFIGIKEGGRYEIATLKCLPFYTGAVQKAADAFLVEQAGPAEQNVKPDAEPFKAEEFQRFYGWSTDSWKAGNMSFTLYTPFGAIADPASASKDEMRKSLLPAVIAQLEIDNSKGKTTQTGFFALNFARNGSRILDADLGPGRVAFAFRHESGVAAELVDLDSKSKIEPFVFMRWSPSDGLREPHNPVHLLGSCPGVGFEVPAGKRYALTLAIGSYLANIETTRLEGRYLYTRYYQGLADVLRAALDRAPELKSTAAKQDEQLEATSLSADQKFMIAHSTRSYYGNTELMEVDGRPLWIVNEGEYCMMNTLDLAVDQVFWELDRNPWVVRNLLETFLQTYSYVDEVKVYKGAFTAAAAGDRQVDPTQTPPPPDAEQLARPYDLKPGGISFCHDMGAHNNFSPKGRSSYELTNLTGCFSYMTQEQLCNWILIAACYFARTRDAAWLKQNADVLKQCLTSMINRGGDVGFAQYDSSRCAGGQEITTYDSLDHSLAQTRNNVYMAVKCWASYRALALLFRDLGAGTEQKRAEEVGLKVAGVVAEQAVDGILPAVFEKGNPGNKSRILAAIEGCMYPLYFETTGFAKQTLDQIFGAPAERKMFDVLREHTKKLLLDQGRQNLFADGGIKLSSTSNNSWMSKISIFMHVARKVFQLDKDSAVAEVFRQADAAHVKWQVVGSAYWACSDQIVSGEGKASRYYPRVITSALWMS